MNKKMIAVCGLDCYGCPIHKASLGDIEAAQMLVGWWQAEGWLKKDEGVEAQFFRGFATPPVTRSLFSLRSLFCHAYGAFRGLRCLCRERS